MDNGLFSRPRRWGGLRLFDAKLPEGGQNYRVFRFPWVGRPSERPELALAKTRAKLYVSWNGATEVAVWQLRAETKRAGLKPASTTRRAGFETVLEVPAGADYAAAVAFDHSGRPIGTSDTVRI